MSDTRNGKALKKEKKSWMGKMMTALRRVFAGGEKARPVAVDKQPMEQQEAPAEQFEEPVFTEPELELSATSADVYEEERIENLDLSSLSLEELMERVSATTPTAKRSRESDVADQVGSGQKMEPVTAKSDRTDQIRSAEEVQPEQSAQNVVQSMQSTSTAPVDPEQNVQSTSKAPVDPVQNVQSTSTAPVDPAQNVQSTSTASVDLVQNVQSTPPAPAEPASSVQSVQSIPVQTVQNTQPARTDANLVDLNNTTAEVLIERLGLKALDAQKAMSVCEAIDGFTSLQQFCDALGFRPHVVERLRPLVKITPRQKKK